MYIYVYIYIYISLLYTIYNILLLTIIIYITKCFEPFTFY